jgi:hypothetical protein
MAVALRDPAGLPIGAIHITAAAARWKPKELIERMPAELARDIESAEPAGFIDE